VCVLVALPLSDPAQSELTGLGLGAAAAAAGGGGQGGGHGGMGGHGRASHITTAIHSALHEVQVRVLRSIDIVYCDTWGEHLSAVRCRQGGAGQALALEHPPGVWAVPRPSGMAPPRTGSRTAAARRAGGAAQSHPPATAAPSTQLHTPDHTQLHTQLHAAQELAAELGDPDDGEERDEWWGEGE
jgi:hypothetical protein